MPITAPTPPDAIVKEKKKNGPMIGQPNCAKKRKRSNETKREGEEEKKDALVCLVPCFITRRVRRDLTALECSLASVDATKTFLALLSLLLLAARPFIVRGRNATG